MIINHLDLNGNKMSDFEFDITPKIIEAKEGKTLNKPFRTPKGPKKFSVYVKNEKGNVVKVNFGDPNMEIKRDDPNRRKNFRARHNCDNPGPKTKARYWSCKMWEARKSVSDYTKGSQDWDGQTFADQDELLKIYPELKNVEEITEADCGCQNKECGCCDNNDSGCDCNKTDDSESNAAHEDHEISMAETQLMKIAVQSAQLVELMRTMRDGSDIMAWAQDKISKAEHFVEAVHDYMMYSNSNAALTEKQKKLPPALQKAILKKQGKKPEKEEEKEDDKKGKDEEEDKKENKNQKGLTEKQKKLPPALQKAILKKQSKAGYASLWKNIHEKRERIKRGSGEKMRKKGEKGAPTPEQLKKAKDKTKAKDLEDHVALPVLKHKRTASEYSELWKKINEK